MHKREFGLERKFSRAALIAEAGRSHAAGGRDDEAGIYSRAKSSIVRLKSAFLLLGRFRADRERELETEGDLGGRCSNPRVAGEEGLPYSPTDIRRPGRAQSVAMNDERELLRACFEGEKGAWDDFVGRYSRLIHGTIKQTLRVYHSDADQSVVEDLFQDFFLSVFRDHFKKLRQFRGERGCSLASWLRMVAARLTIDFLRKQKDPGVLMHEPPAANGTDPSTGLLHKEKEKVITALISALPAGDRLLIELSFKQELSAEDIAVMLGTTVNAVYTRRSRLVAKLKEAMKQAEIL